MILNLTNLEESDIKYQIQKFPDGQQNIVITDIKGTTWSEYKFGESLLSTNTMIKSRLNNWLDLELIVCVVASLRELGVDEIQLYVPYIMGARSDRKFEEGGNNYLKDVICPVINSLNFKTVTCIDPHSDVLEACIKGFRKGDNKLLTSFALHGIYGNLSVKSNVDLNKFILVSPDAGASKKIYKLAEQIKYKGDIITCSKERDKDGKLTKVNVPSFYKGKDVIIIDDICDGGATFINIAKIIKERNEKYPDEKHPIGKIYLIVTHGIFSKGFEELSKYFDSIYCTNSYSNWYSEEFKEGKNVKQLNVF